MSEYTEYTVRKYKNRTEWCNKNGKLHRDDGPAIEHANGTKLWWINGKLHRDDGPAIEYADGTKSWYKNGQFHRDDGPAVEYANGNKEWWINGKELTEAKFNARTKLCSYNGKIVEIEGKKYQLKEIK